MIAWLLTGLPGQVAALAFAVWFLNGLRKAFFRQRLEYVSHAPAEGGWLFTVRRQELLPPWRRLEETWLLPKDGPRDYRPDLAPIRVSDGRRAFSGGNETRLGLQLRALLYATDQHRRAKAAASKKMERELDELIAEHGRLDAIIKTASKNAN